MKDRGKDIAGPEEYGVSYGLNSEILANARGRSVSRRNFLQLAGIGLLAAACGPLSNLGQEQPDLTPDVPPTVPATARAEAATQVPLTEVDLISDKSLDSFFEECSAECVGIKREEITGWNMGGHEFIFFDDAKTGYQKGFIQHNNEWKQVYGTYINATYVQWYLLTSDVATPIPDTPTPQPGQSVESFLPIVGYDLYPATLQEPKDIVVQYWDPSNDSPNRAFEYEAYVIKSDGELYKGVVKNAAVTSFEDPKEAFDLAIVTGPEGESKMSYCEPKKNSDGTWAFVTPELRAAVKPLLGKNKGQEGKPDYITHEYGGGVVELPWKDFYDHSELLTICKTSLEPFGIEEDAYIFAYAYDGKDGNQYDKYVLITKDKFEDMKKLKQFDRRYTFCTWVQLPNNNVPISGIPREKYANLLENLHTAQLGPDGDQKMLELGQQVVSQDNFKPLGNVVTFGGLILY